MCGLRAFRWRQLWASPKLSMLCMELGTWQILESSWFLIQHETTTLPKGSEDSWTPGSQQHQPQDRLSWMEGGYTQDEESWCPASSMKTTVQPIHRGDKEPGVCRGTRLHWHFYHTCLGGQGEDAGPFPVLQTRTMLTTTSNRLFE